MRAGETPYSMPRIAEAILGGDDTEIKTRVSEQAATDGKRKARALGYRSMSEFVRDAVHIAIYGRAAVEQCHRQRIAGVGQDWDNAWPDSAFGAGLGVGDVEGPR